MTIKDSNKIRLVYVYFEPFTGYYYTKDVKIGHTHMVSSSFKLPENMTIPDACKVVSYLFNKVEQENNLSPVSEQSVNIVSNLLEEYGFKKVGDKDTGHYHVVEEYSPSEIISPPFKVLGKKYGVIDFFTVEGDLNLFKRSEFYNRYFKWYSKNVPQTEIENIYKNIGKEDLINDTYDNTNTF